MAPKLQIIRINQVESMDKTQIPFANDLILTFL